MADLIDIAWAAGLYEGEGCICAHPDKRRRNSCGVEMSLSMKDEEPVRRFASVVGGRVYGPYYQPGKPMGTQESFPPMWIWRIGARQEVARVLWLLKDLLSARRREQLKTSIRRARSIRNGRSFTRRDGRRVPRHST